MKITVVGCTGSMSGPNSSASSYLIQADDGTRTWSIICDLGPGSMGQLLNHLDPRDLDAIAISHCHADHMVDLVGMHVYRRWHPQGALGPVLCIGPSVTRDRVRGTDGTTAEETYDTEFTFVTAQHGHSITVGPMTITPFDALHPVEAYGYRIEGPSVDGGRVTMAYTGDTDSCDTITQMAQGVDFLLSEAAFTEQHDPVRGMHLTGRRAGELAQEAGVGRLVLTHIQPWTDTNIPLAEAREVFDGPIDVATAESQWML
ncbi:MBL fold metallo-hydrolase [Actinomyces vulturis]|uniref:MBL fold metallo-hydrolase n=1 Tax=Actinomyces vulturis TaxID=1857645 RepID=UPI00083405E0|nr:MBL fold metallo-hydrolase [Actinomyces vulturis]